MALVRPKDLPAAEKVVVSPALQNLCDWQEPQLDLILAGWRHPDEILETVSESFHTELERLRTERHQKGASS